MARMKTILMLVMLAMAAGTALSAGTWTPPANPDPRTILNEARADRAARRFEDATQKHVWFHNEALRYQPAMVGVRLSFALGDWGLLASRYEPAMAALRGARAAAAEGVRSGVEVERAFADLAAIDAELDESWATQRDFRGLAERDETAARAVFPRAADALIETKDFTTYAKYADPESELSNLLRLRADMMRTATSFPGAGESNERLFAEKAGRMVAALVLGGRTADAKAVAARMRAGTEASATHETLRQALEGTVPPPFVPSTWKSTFRHLMP